MFYKVTAAAMDVRIRPLTEHRNKYSNETAKIKLLSRISGPNL
jgi:hypothetical protein